MGTAEVRLGQDGIDARIGRISTLTAIPLIALTATGMDGMTGLALAATVLVGLATVAAMLGTLFVPLWRSRVWLGYPVLWSAVATIWTAGHVWHNPGWQLLWIWTLSPYAISLAALRHRLGIAIMLGAAPPLTGLAICLATGQPLSPGQVSEAALHLANVWFAVLVSAARHHLFQSWLSTWRVRQEERRVAVSRMWEAERLRLAALIHDHVLTVLVAAPQLAATNPDAVRQAVDQVEDLLSSRPRVTVRDVSLAELSHRLVALAAGVPAEVVGAAPGTGAVPGAVADAMVEATAEALRNCARHAGGANVRVSMLLTEAAIEVEIADDGPGFDPDCLPPERLGISTSILARVQAVSGGDATVSSRPGAGTCVRLSWRRTVRSPGADPGLTDEPRIAVVSGVASPASRLVLILACSVGLGWAVLARPEFSAPVAVGLAMLWVLAATVLVTSTRELSLPAVMLVSLVAAGASLAVFAQAGVDVTTERWLVQFGADLLGMLALRGRVVAASVGFTLQVLVVAGVSVRDSAPGLLALLVLPAVALVAGALWNRSLRQSLVRMAVEQDQRDHAELAAEAAQLTAERATEWMGDLARMAAPALTGLRACAGRDLSQLCLGVASGMRDRLRAPNLAGGVLDRPVGQARARGIRVDVLDDRQGDGALDPDLLARVAAILDSQASGRVVIRALPPGREAVVSVLTDDGLEVQRFELPGPAAPRLGPDSDGRPGSGESLGLDRVELGRGDRAGVE